MTRSLGFGLLLGAGEGLDLTRAIESFRRTEAEHAADATAARCFLALADVVAGTHPVVDTTGFDRSAPYCAWAISVSAIPLDSGAMTTSALSRADSVLRQGLFTSNFLEGYEAKLLARAWERASNLPRALAAIRYRQVGFFAAETPWNLPEEGRLAALVGDTTGAIHAYQQWLQITRDAEPYLTPKRDSVRAALARLKTKP